MDLLPAVLAEHRFFGVGKEQEMVVLQLDLSVLPVMNVSCCALRGVCGWVSI